jgi:hypothetical protein
MNQDTEHLRLLAIFHYVAAGLAAFFSLFPLIYTTIGVIFVFVARHGTPKPREELPPEFLGWIFVGIGSFLFLVGDSHVDLHSDRRTMPLASQRLFLRAGDGLHRMSLCSVWNYSRGLYDCRPFARVGEGIIPHSFDAATELKLDVGL